MFTESSGSIDLPVNELIKPSGVSLISETIGAYYSLPTEIIQRGVNTEIQVVQSNEFQRLLASHIQSLEDYVNKNPISKSRAQVLLEETVVWELIHKIEDDRSIDEWATQDTEVTRACFLPQQNGERVILVKETILNEDEFYLSDVLEHEILHSMSCEGFGLPHQGLTLKLTNGGCMFNNLNEASTELLRLSRLTGKSMVQLTQPEGLGHFMAYLDDSFYPFESMILLKGLLGYSLFSSDGVKFTFEELAQYYFGSRDEFSNPLDFSNDLFNRISKERRTEAFWEYYKHLMFDNKRSDDD